jgi:hypothetical protein
VRLRGDIGDIVTNVTNLADDTSVFPRHHEDPVTYVNGILRKPFKARGKGRVVSNLRRLSKRSDVVARMVQNAKKGPWHDFKRKSFLVQAPSEEELVRSKNLDTLLAVLSNEIFNGPRPWSWAPVSLPLAPRLRYSRDECHNGVSA